MNVVVTNSKKGKSFFLSICAVLLLFLAACGADAENQTNDNEENTEQEQEAQTNENDVEEQSNKSEEGQLTLENDGVDESDLEEVLEQFPEETPERVITTSVPLAEMLHLLDIIPVGVPTSTNPLPEEFASIDQIGSPMAPDLEVVTDLTPDLILGAESLRSTLEESLNGMDLSTAYLRTDSFDDLKLSFKALGTYFNKTEEMNEKLQAIIDKENELMALTDGKELPTVMLMIGTSDSFMVMNEKSYLGSLIERLGADNIATSILEAKETYSAMNMEEVVMADPDLILVLASGDHGASEEMFQKEVESNDLWTNLSAYQNDQIHILDYDVFGVTSIANVETALTEVANYFVE